MRFLILAAVATALTAVAMSPSAQAAQRHNRHSGVTGAPATVYQQQLPYGGYGYGHRSRSERSQRNAARSAERPLSYEATS